MNALKTLFIVLCIIFGAVEIFGAESLMIALCYILGAGVIVGVLLFIILAMCMQEQEKRRGRNEHA